MTWASSWFTVEDLKRQNYPGDWPWKPEWWVGDVSRGRHARSHENGSFRDGLDEYSAAFRRAVCQLTPVSVADDLIQAVRRPPRIVSGGGGEPVDFGHAGDIMSTTRSSDSGTGGVRACDELSGIRRRRKCSEYQCGYCGDSCGGGSPGRGAIPGDRGTRVLRDPEDPTSRIPILEESSSQRWIANGVISGGMIPKLEESFGAMKRGPAAFISWIHPPRGGLEKGADGGRLSRDGFAPFVLGRGGNYQPLHGHRSPLASFHCS